MLGRKTWRVYYNKRSEYPLIWSVDSGPGTLEHKFETVKMIGLVRSVSDMQHRGSTEKPCAWFEVRGVLYTDIDGRRAEIHDKEDS